MPPQIKRASGGSVNSLFVFLGIESWKPVITALVLPPVPFIILILIGARLILPRRGLGWSVLVLGLLGVWFGSTTAAGRFIEDFIVDLPPAISGDRIAKIKADPKLRATSAIVVLGGGAESFAPEYGMSNLASASIARLRYGLWLGRETGIPVAFSGGVGWAAQQTTPEAEIAARVASQEFKQALKWTESQSRDTRENAGHSLAMLKRAGITHVIVVTHGWHMHRSMRAFKEAAAASGMSVEPAPMGLARGSARKALDWLPSKDGYERVNNNMRELLGRMMGA